MRNKRVMRWSSFGTSTYLPLGLAQDQLCSPEVLVLLGLSKKAVNVFFEHIQVLHNKFVKLLLFGLDKVSHSMEKGVTEESAKEVVQSVLNVVNGVANVGSDIGKLH